MSVAAVSAAAGATATLAYAVDYHVVPKRLTPGFEAHLSGRSMFYVYAAFATRIRCGSAMPKKVVRQ
jgi:hypothetical protein